jgi:hypothetical protein
MDVPGGIVRMEHQLVDLRRIEMKYARLVMIDPDDRVIVLVHNSAPC